MIIQKLRKRFEEFNMNKHNIYIYIYIYVEKTMVEAMANSVEYYLIDGLSFKLSPGASYVSERKSVSWFASGAQSYISGQGARVIRLQINGDGWLDPSTVRLIYTLRNNSTTTAALLRPICGPWSFFRRARMLMGGAICDDIDSYG